MYKQKLRALARESSFPIVAYGPGHFVLTPSIVAELRVKSYLEQWQAALMNEWFHVRLADQSLFLFAEGLAPSYSYLQCPLDLMPFAEFLSQSGLENTPENRRTYFSQYETFMETAGLRDNVTPIRFDFHPAGYRSGVHPVGHVHIGLDNEVRLSTNKMDAVAFVLFVMRQMYPYVWEKLLARSSPARVSSLVRHSDCAIPLQFQGVLDRVELYYR